MKPLVLDTNILLDLWVFDDPQVTELKQFLQRRPAVWLATGPMRAELARVLTYEHLARRIEQNDDSSDHILARFDAWHIPVAVASKAPWTCQDPDDQPFIDLAFEHQAWLVSKDNEVLRMARRLAQGQVRVCKVFSRSEYDHPVDDR